MMSIARARRAGTTLALLCLVLANAPHAWGQAFTTPDDTLFVSGRSAVEEGYLSFLNINRAVLGPRSVGMGGTGLALPQGGLQFFTTNPAQLLETTTWEIVSEFSFLSGGGGVDAFPSRIVVGPNQSLESSNYRVNPALSSDYRSLSLGLPIVLLGNRGAVAVSYRRVSGAFQGDETRFEASGPITQNIPATIGVGLEPDGSHDAITLGVARAMSDNLNLGLNLNFQSGEAKQTTDIGISVFGQAQGGGGWNYSQDVRAFNIDLGGTYRAGKLSLGGSMYLGHDLKFENGTAQVFPLPDIQNPDAPILMFQQSVLDHTLSIPTSFAFGAAYEVNDRLTLAADYWIRPWSNVDIARAELTPQLFFVDPADSTTFGYVLTQGSGTETFSARLDDANSLRIGAEYLIYQSDGLTIPLRLGFRSEGLALNDIVVTEQQADFTEFIFDYWRYNVDGQTPPEGVDADQIARDLETLLEFKNLAFQGDGVTATTISMGLGFYLGPLTIDVALENQSYNVDRFFYLPFDPLVNPSPDDTEETRSIRTFTLSTTMRF